MPVDSDTLAATRRSLHGVAELLLAGPQYAACREISLRPTAGGFGTTHTPMIRVEGTELVVGELRAELDGRTPREVGRAVGIVPSGLGHVYPDGSGVSDDEQLSVDPAAALEIATAYALGDQALRALGSGEAPILWPEHFDIAISADEVNYGVSPGDGHVAVPYAYVGPWNPPEQDEFWNASFGASRPLALLPDADAVRAFFEEGRSRLGR